MQPFPYNIANKRRNTHATENGCKVKLSTTVTVYCSWRVTIQQYKNKKQEQERYCGEDEPEEEEKPEEEEEQQEQEEQEDQEEEQEKEEEQKEQKNKNKKKTNKYKKKKNNKKILYGQQVCFWAGDYLTQLQW